MELEDPPLVLATKVCRAMVYVLLDECLPKHTDVKDMSVEELRLAHTVTETCTNIKVCFVFLF